MIQSLIPSIVSICLITITLYLRNFIIKKDFSEKSSWDIADNSYDEWPRIPNSFPKEKNSQGLYLDRIPILSDTILQKNGSIYSFVKIAGESINHFPLHALAHSSDEYYLTTILFSFHVKNGITFLDILSLDNDYPLDNNELSLLFTNGRQWDFILSQDLNNKYACSILLSWEQITYLSENTLEKWRIRITEDNSFTVGTLNFETRKYIYKPEIQHTIQMMAKTILEFDLRRKNISLSTL